MASITNVATMYELPRDSLSAVFIVLLSLLTLTFVGAVCLHGYSRRYVLWVTCILTCVIDPMRSLMLKFITIFWGGGSPMNITKI